MLNREERSRRENTYKIAVSDSRAAFKDAFTSEGKARTEQHSQKKTRQSKKKQQGKHTEICCVSFPRSSEAPIRDEWKDAIPFS